MTYIKKLNKLLSDLDFVSDPENLQELHDGIIFLDVVLRICKDDANYINENFPIDLNEEGEGDRLYIDGVTTYSDKVEKDIINRVLKQIKEEE